MLTKACARGGCTSEISSRERWLFDRRRYCSRRCGALAKYLVRDIPSPQPCGRPGCEEMGRPVYCSRKCAALVIARQKPHEYFVAIGVKGRASLRKVGRDVLTAPDLSLMQSGRYREAARQIYDRAYTAGWVARHTGCRQLPAKKQKGQASVNGR